MIGNNDIKTSEILIDYLEGQLDKHDKKLVEDWINANAENKIFFNEVKEIWENDEKTHYFDEINMHDELERLHKGIDNDSSNKSINFSLLLKIAAIFIVAIGLFYLFSHKSQEMKMLSTSNQITTDTLNDGTLISLNKRSTLKYPEKFRKQRKVILEGEAFFEVNPDKNKPFIVDCGKAKVVVCGTSFNVEAYPGKNIIVTVKTGEVYLAKNETPTENISKSSIIKEGQKGVFSLSEDNIQIEENDHLNFLSWKDGVLIFKDAKLAEVAKVLEEHFEVEIKINDKKISGRRLTADFDNMELLTILEIIKTTLGIDYRIDNNNIEFFQ